jgi:dipeptidyl aminopeptidase/acylaminoacyl peptidase
LKTQLRLVSFPNPDGDAPRGVDLSKPMLLRAKNLHSQDTGFYSFTAGSKPKLLTMGARDYGVPVKAKRADTLLIRVRTYFDGEDYYVTDPMFHNVRKVTDINPRKNEFNWGKAELVSYKSLDGVELSGVLIKPENFDSSKKYPMIVYIYERLSDTLHNFRLPSAGTSINPTYYASNGYLVFMPDITYTVGSPGQSALKCVLPAIQSVVDKGIVNEDAIGIQGHSWGGYQIAYMVTQTNRFKAASSGAPVSNMVSAYGGIRWTTGLPREFQYERTQSRIGATLWQAPMKFIENSPIFMADRVTTPLMILHNDQDGAVPWYQGIEYYLALRRLGKECYLFNYNGEDHGLRRKATQRDYTVRMQQFFDHHLKGAPMPDWMAKGIPYSEREKEKEQYKKLFRADD